MAATKSPATKATKKAAPADGGSMETSPSVAKKAEAATKAPAKKAAATSSTSPTGTSRAAAGKKAATSKATAKKAPSARIPTTKSAVKKSAVKKSAVKKSAVKKSSAKKSSAKKSSAKKRSTSVHAVRDGESPWTAEEVAEVRALLESDRERLQVEISAVEEEIGHLLREGGEGAGHDQADVGSNTFERDHEMSIAKNARDNLVLVTEAISRIDHGGYGVCESCGRPIGKMRLQAFPRATLCMECKQRQERR